MSRVERSGRIDLPCSVLISTDDVCFDHEEEDDDENHYEFGVHGQKNKLWTPI